jgi:hypothetical protein
VLTLLPLKAFPTAGQLAGERPARLRELCRVGYRDGRIVELARLFSTPPAKGGVDLAALEDPATPVTMHNTPSSCLVCRGGEHRAVVRAVHASAADTKCAAREKRAEVKGAARRS